MVLKVKYKEPVCHKEKCTCHCSCVNFSKCKKESFSLLYDAEYAYSTLFVEVGKVNFLHGCEDSFMIETDSDNYELPLFSKIVSVFVDGEPLFVEGKGLPYKEAD